jgi:hypothetical protein
MPRGGSKSHDQLPIGLMLFENQYSVNLKLHLSIVGGVMEK